MAGDTYEVQRRTTIAAPPGEIYDRIVNLHRWQSWSPWEDLDPNLQRTYSGAEAGVGAAYEWSGNRKAGEGRMEIVDVTPNEHVSIALQFVKPFKSRSTTEFALEADGDATTVVWTMIGPKTFMTRVMGIFTSMDKMIGPDFERGLAQLKAGAEAG